MTKEELDEEAEEFTDSKKSFWRQGRTCIDSVKQAYIAGAEPREKRIADLEKENAELKEKVERYYCLLEKSMDCETCKYCDFSDDMKKEPCNSCFFDSSKWELKEEDKIR